MPDKRRGMKKMISLLSGGMLTGAVKEELSASRYNLERGEIVLHGTNACSEIGTSFCSLIKNARLTILPLLPS